MAPHDRGKTEAEQPARPASVGLPSGASPGAARSLGAYAVVVADGPASEAAAARFGKGSGSVLPACVTTIRRLRNDPRVPRSAKISVAIAGLWVLSPIWETLAVRLFREFLDRLMSPA